MKATRIAIINKEKNERKWDELAVFFEDLGTDDMVAIAKERYPEDFISEDVKDILNYEEDVEGEIQDETADYILTWKDGMGEVLRIYKKL